MARAKTPPVVVLFGDEEYQKSKTLTTLIDELLPPEIDRGMALSIYDGGQREEYGGPVLAQVMDDLRTLPFLAPHRVVVVREAESFISEHRDKLERYVERPAPTGYLILETKSFPKTTRLHKAVVAAGGRVVECRKMNNRGLAEFVVEEAASFDKRIDRPAVGTLLDLIGAEQGMLAAEVEKLALFVGDRPTISREDVHTLIGQTREEKIFAVMDAAAAGELEAALRLWRQVLATDSAAVFRAVGGLAFVLRRWLMAQRMRAEGASVRTIAPKVMMWGRERELDALLQRLSEPRMKRLLASLAELDAEAKVGNRSIETGVEALLCDAAR